MNMEIDKLISRDKKHMTFRLTGLWRLTNLEFLGVFPGIISIIKTITEHNDDEKMRALIERADEVGERLSKLCVQPRETNSEHMEAINQLRLNELRAIMGVVKYFKQSNSNPERSKHAKTLEYFIDPKFTRKKMVNRPSISTVITGLELEQDNEQFVDALNALGIMDMYTHLLKIERDYWEAHSERTMVATADERPKISTVEVRKEAQEVLRNILRMIDYYIFIDKTEEYDELLISLAQYLKSITALTKRRETMRKKRRLATNTPSDNGSNSVDIEAELNKIDDQIKEVANKISQPVSAPHQSKNR